MPIRTNTQLLMTNAICQFHWGLSVSASSAQLNRLDQITCMSSSKATREFVLLMGCSAINMVQTNLSVHFTLTCIALQLTATSVSAHLSNCQVGRSGKDTAQNRVCDLSRRFTNCYIRSFQKTRGSRTTFSKYQVPHSRANFIASYKSIGFNYNV